MFEHSADKLVLSHFAPITPPSVNMRYKIAGKRIFKNAEVLQFVKSLSDSLDCALRFKPMRSGQFYYCQLIFLADFYDVEVAMLNGDVMQEALGNLGRYRPDLDNLIKATLDCVKSAICNDDRWNTELACAKVQYPQNPGVIIEVFHANLLELRHLDGQVHSETLKKVRGNP